MKIKNVLGPFVFLLGGVGLSAKADDSAFDSSLVLKIRNEGPRFEARPAPTPRNETHYEAPRYVAPPRYELPRFIAPPTQHYEEAPRYVAPRQPTAPSTNHLSGGHERVPSAPHVTQGPVINHSAPPMVQKGISGTAFTKQTLGNSDVKKTATNKSGNKVELFQSHSGLVQLKTLDQKTHIQTVTNVHVNPRTGRSEVTIEHHLSNGSMERIQHNGSRIIVSRDQKTVQFIHANGLSITRTRLDYAGGYKYRRAYSTGQVVNYDYRLRAWGPFHFGVYYTDWAIWGPYYDNPWFYTTAAAAIVYPWAGFSCAPWLAWCFAPQPSYLAPVDLVTDLMLQDYLADQAEFTADAAIFRQQQQALVELQDTREQLAETQQELADAQTRATQAQQMLTADQHHRISTEVQQVLLANKSHQPLTIQDTLKNKDFIYFVDEMGIDAVTKSGDTCSLNQGDLVQVVGQNTARPSTSVQLVVLATNSLGCKAQEVITVSALKLQDMLNEFQQHSENAMKKAQAVQVPGGLK